MLETKILTTEQDVESIAGEWRELFARAGASPFADGDLFLIWWRTIGKTDGQRVLHVVTGRENGKLTAVLPLTVVRRKGLRIMQAAGYKSYNYADMLAATTEQAVALWQAARRSPHYDFADIRDVYPESKCYEALSAFACRRDLTDAFSLRLQWPAGKDWIASLPSHTRANFNRCVRRLGETGTLRFDVHQGEPLPAAIVDKMVEQKVAWGVANKMHGVLEHPGVMTYYRRALENAARQGNLFLCWLTCGDDVIAYNQGLIHNGVLHGMLWTYNPAWSKYSPGNIVLFNAVLWAIDHGMRAVDFRQGGNQFKRQHSNDVRQCAEFTFNGSLRGQLIEKTYMSARELKRRIRGRITAKED